jgi:hypothetical protein
MMNTKALIQLGGAGLLTVVLSACSPSNESSNDGDSSTQTAVQGQPIKKLAQTEEPAVAGDPIQPLADATIGPGDTIEAVPENPTVAGTESGAAPADSDVGATEVAGKADSLKEPTATIRSGDKDYFSLGFDELASFEFEMSDELLEAKGDPAEITEKTNNQIPPTIRAFDEKAVAVKGYMLPLKVEKGAVTEFLIMRDQSMCCFGTVPKINEWVSVKTVGGGVKPIMDEPVTIFGKLHVGEMRENGYLVGIYTMDGEKLAGPLDL